jgi:hypothetical protein
VCATDVVFWRNLVAQSVVLMLFYGKLRGDAGKGGLC